MEQHLWEPGDAGHGGEHHGLVVDVAAPQSHLDRHLLAVAAALAEEHLAVEALAQAPRDGALQATVAVVARVPRRYAAPVRLRLHEQARMHAKQPQRRHFTGFEQNATGNSALIKRRFDENSGRVFTVG